MIKFFRHIRKNLLAEGKNKNYLKYAIGRNHPYGHRNLDCVSNQQLLKKLIQVSITTLKYMYKCILLVVPYTIYQLTQKSPVTK